MEFINDANKRSMFMAMMEEFERYDDLKADLEGDKCYDHIDSVKRMWIKIELPSHFDEGFMSMVAWKDWKDKILITYFLTYGEKEHEFENYYEMMGDEKCEECGVYGWEECKSDCEYQARREREKEGIKECCEKCNTAEAVYEYWWIENENKKWLLCEQCGIEEEQEKCK